jgi:hypothetical protein
MSLTSSAPATSASTDAQRDPGAGDRDGYGVVDQSGGDPARSATRSGVRPFAIAHHRQPAVERWRESVRDVGDPDAPADAGTVPDARTGSHTDARTQGDPDAHAAPDGGSWSGGDSQAHASTQSGADDQADSQAHASPDTTADHPDADSDSGRDTGTDISPDTRADSDSDADAVAKPDDLTGTDPDVQPRRPPLRRQADQAAEVGG